jgi:fructokinase
MTRKATDTTEFKDACGSGDWCSAGILSMLCADPVNNATRLHFNCKSVDAAIAFGQALASINCEYEGARGAMYAFSGRRAKLIKLARERAQLTIC